MASADTAIITVGPEMLEEILGVSLVPLTTAVSSYVCSWSFLQPRKFEHEVSERLTQPGVAVGQSITYCA